MSLRADERSAASGAKEDRPLISIAAADSGQSEASWKTILRRIVPQWILMVYRRHRLVKVRNRFATTSVKEAFSAIYRERLWGGFGRDDFSGIGSRQQWAADYVDAVCALIARERPERVVDLGCGDFGVGSEIVSRTGVRYVGVDVVPEIVEYHRRTNAGPRVQFECLDISFDELPKAPICLVRQVFQHLSNDEIAAALQNLKRTYEWIVVTEHLPQSRNLTTANLDKPHGPDTRILDGSGVYLDRSPFSEHFEAILCTTRVAMLGEQESLLQTVLIRGSPSHSPSS